MSATTSLSGTAARSRATAAIPSRLISGVPASTTSTAGPMRRSSATASSLAIRSSATCKRATTRLLPLACPVVVPISTPAPALRNAGPAACLLLAARLAFGVGRRRTVEHIRRLEGGGRHAVALVPGRHLADVPLLIGARGKGAELHQRGLALVQRPVVEEDLGEILRLARVHLRLWRQVELARHGAVHALDAHAEGARDLVGGERRELAPLLPGVQVRLVLRRLAHRTLPTARG